MSRPIFKSTTTLLAGAATALALTSPASAANGVEIYPVAYGNPAFTGALEQHGYTELATEAFERNGSMDDPLNSSGNSLYAPGDIPAGLTFQSNRAAGGEAGPDPIGANALAVNATVVHQERGPNQLRTPVGGSSLDVLVDGNRFWALRFGAQANSTVRVFHADGRLLDSEVLNNAYPGIVADPGVKIGRINITMPTPPEHHGIHGDEYIEEVHLYGPGGTAPQPGPEPTPTPSPAPTPTPAPGYPNNPVGGLLGPIGEITAVTRNVRAGTASLSVTMAGPARATLAATNRVKGAAKRATGAGTVKLPVRLRSGAQRRLERAAQDGRASLRVKVTVRCEAGERSYTSTKRIRLTLAG